MSIEKSSKSVAIVPAGAPRRQVVTNGSIFRFRYEAIVGTRSCKCVEYLFVKSPAVEAVEALFYENEAEGAVFNPADYGYEV